MATSVAPSSPRRAADGRSVLVSGYPPYTQPQDLSRVFAKFGTVKVDRISKKLACLVFDSEDDAQEALDSSDQLNVYGEFLTVKPYDPEEENKPRTPKREFPMTNAKQKCSMVAPSSLDLEGPFEVQLAKTLAAVRLSVEAVAALGRLYSDLEAALRPHWPGCRAVPFGSITTGLGTKSSDADCFMDVPPAQRRPGNTCVVRAKRVLQQYPHIFTEIVAIPRANTPIVKLFHVPTSTSCDVTFKSALGAQNSKLVGFLLQSDRRLLEAAVLLKYWARTHELSGTGRLTNYALTLLVVFYLQQAPAALPAVRRLQRARGPLGPLGPLVAGWDTAFDDRPLPAPAARASVADIVGGFFQYYAAFNFDEMVVCPFLGVPVPKELFRDPARLPPEFELYKTNVLNRNTHRLRFMTPMVIQDPFEQCHNVATAITARLASDLVAYFKFAAEAYEKEKLDEYRGFLPTILLQKPKLVRPKSVPEFRIRLYPRFISQIVESEWKPVVGRLVRTVCEKLLKIDLAKVELKSNPNAKKEKELFLASLSCAIWKNRQCNYTGLSFEERQEQISEELIAGGKQAIHLQFHLVLTHSPYRSSMVTARLIVGDLNHFRELGLFLTSVLQHWCVQLLQAPPAEPSVAETIHELDRQLETNQFADSDDDDVAEALNDPALFASPY